MIAAGEFRQRVTVQTMPEVSDGHDGFVDPQPVTVQARIPARVRPLVGRDLERARQIDPRITHEVTVRYWRNYPTDLDGGRARLVYHDEDNRTFEIVSAPVDIEERHIQIQMLCKEAA